jgi:ribosomal protein L11 methylase PrmA
LASQLLPTRTWWKYSLLAHIHLHAKSQQRYDDIGREQSDKPATKVSRIQFEGVLASLTKATEALSWKHSETEWGNYYNDTNYEDDSMRHKGQLVTRYLRVCEKSEHALAADFGANTGRFSRLAAEQGFFVLAHDVDVVAVDKNYLIAKNNAETSILPLVQDFSTPSPSIGWANEERESFVERHYSDVGMALAIIHHLHISNNVPLDRIAKFFSEICKALIIEFVPKSDSQVIRLLSTREDIFTHYTLEGFKAAFSKYFDFVEAEKITGTERTLCFLRAR